MSGQAQSATDTFLGSTSLPDLGFRADRRLSLSGSRLFRALSSREVVAHKDLSDLRCKILHVPMQDVCKLDALPVVLFIADHVSSAYSFMFCSQKLCTTGASCFQLFHLPWFVRFPTVGLRRIMFPAATLQSLKANKRVFERWPSIVRFGVADSSLGFCSSQSSQVISHALSGSLAALGSPI